MKMIRMKNKKLKVPFFLPFIDKSDISKIKNAALSTYLTNGPRLETFEKQFQKFTNCKYAIGVSNATSALHISLKALGIGSGDEVIVPDLTFAATANSVLQSGAVPVIADVDEKTLNISPNSIIKNINKKTKAIIPVHFAGTTCDMQQILKISKKHSLKIIEDCAHGIGSYLNKKHVGTFGSTGCFSFYPTKNLTTIEGGMIITNNKKIAKFAQLARNHGLNRTLMNRYSSGKPWDYDIKHVGYNYRLDEIRCAIGISQLEKIKKLNKKRLTAFRYYNKLLSDLPGLILPLEENFQNSSCHLYIIRITNKAKINRDQLFHYLQKNGIGTTVHYKPLHKFTIFQNNSFQRKKLVISKKLYKEILSLPLYPQLTKSNQDYVAKYIKKALF
tara:strand:- start:1121 stop:2284 length:1164 start_codon:yes stop_codon:yes gene_type:complete